MIRRLWSVSRAMSRYYPNLCFRLRITAKNSTQGGL